MTIDILVGVVSIRPYQSRRSTLQYTICSLSITLYRDVDSMTNNSKVFCSSKENGAFPKELLLNWEVF